MVGGGINMFPSYLARYNWVVADESPMEITMNIHLDETGEMIFGADVEMTGDISTANNKIIFIITKYWSDNYFCTVSSYEQLDFDLTSTGETGTYETFLDLDESWDIDDLQAVVIIQTLSGDHKIHQANIGSIESVLQIMAPSSIDFGEVPVGQSTTEQFRLTNFWDEEMSGIIFPASGFEIVDYFSVPSNETITIDLTFAPTEETYYDNFIILMSENEYFQTQLLPVTGTGISGTESSDQTVNIKDLALSNYPNPFNPQTTIYFNLPSGTKGNTELAIYNINGQQVRLLINESLPAGAHSAIWDGTDNNGISVPSGIYLYKINNDQISNTKKMILLK